jgi:hypothetical protein
LAPRVSRRIILAVPVPRLAALVAGLTVAAGPAAAADRPMGHVFDWSHELAQRRLPQWDPTTAPPIAPARWYRAIDATLRAAGRNGLWFGGYHALPFDIPEHPREPAGWRTPARLAREFRATGLRWDVNLEARAAANALTRRQAAVADPSESAPTRRLSLIDPGYEAAALAEIRRLVPRYAALPYVHAYTGSDEPVAVLPRGAGARTLFAARLRRDVRARYGWDPPVAGAAPTGAPAARLRWLAYSRHVSERFFAMKRRQAAAIRRLDPDAVVVPNDFGFIGGFMPWDYTELADIADIVEADPYTSLDERAIPGRGRYNHGFGAKLLSDLTGKPVRIIVQAFPYAGYRPTPADVEAWTAQALRAGATHISFYALANPRYTNRPLYRRLLSIARRLRGTRLPAAPADPATVVVYSTASEGQAQPHRREPARYRTGGDALYTTYATLGELSGGAFTFDADTRLVADPRRLDRARLVWLPRADTLDRAFAERLAVWVRAGGTLIATDPRAFTRSPDGASLADVRDALVGADPGPGRPERVATVVAGALGLGSPARPLPIPLHAARRGFTAVPSGATVLARFADGTPVAFVRPVGAGRVIAFASDPMSPRALVRPAGLPELVAALQRSGGGALGHPAWDYALPGSPDPGHAPWPGAPPG